MKDSLLKINSYNALISEIEDIRNTKFSFDDAECVNMIKKLWHGLKGEHDLVETNISSRWSEIGFQGTNPSTDFRGMGLLGLVNLR